MLTFFLGFVLGVVGTLAVLVAVATHDFVASVETWTVGDDD